MKLTSKSDTKNKRISPKSVYQSQCFKERSVYSRCKRPKVTNQFQEEEMGWQWEVVSKLSDQPKVNEKIENS